MWDAGSEIRHAVRSLLRAKSYAVAAVLTLALAVAANTMVFSVVDSVLLEPLPYPASDRLIALSHAAPGLNLPQIGISPGLYHHYREQTSAFEELALFRQETVNLTGEGETPARLDAAAVSHTWLATLGVEPVAGRSFTAEEDAPGGPPVVILSHSLWRERFGGDPSVIGRTIRVDGVAREIVGVTPAGFMFPSRDVQLWYPLGMDLPSSPPGAFSYRAIARLASGATLAQARRQMDGVVSRLGEEYPNVEQLTAFLQQGRFASTATPLKEAVVGDLRRPLWILLGTAALVLIIACANVTNLFLVRAEARCREIAVRSALGAHRLALARHFLTETLLLSIVASGLGALLAIGGTGLLLRMAPPNLPRLDEVRVDTTALLFAGALALIIALLLALIPAIRLTAPSVLSLVSRAGTRTTASRERNRARQALVVVQTAIALVLLAGSGLMLRTFGALRGMDPGFDAENVLTFHIALPNTTYADAASAATFHERLLEQLRAMPGVQAAGGVAEIPLGGTASGTAFDIEGQPVAPGSLPPMLRYTYATQGYFDALRIPIRRGEVFEHADREATRRVVVISEKIAERFWPQQDPIGRRLRASGFDNRDWSTVIGVVGDVHNTGLSDEPEGLVYYPIISRPDDDSIAGVDGPIRSMTFAVRTPEPSALANAVRNAVWSLDRDLPITTMTTMEELVARSMTQISFTMVALLIAAALALFLGAIGLYGVISYMVTQRTRELGLRMALGAEAHAVRRMVVWQGMRLALVGLVIGSLGALAATRVLDSLLFDTRPADPATFAAVILVLGLVSIVASWLPAQRAARVDPARSLQEE